MMKNEVLKAMEECRSFFAFEPPRAADEQLAAILEAGRFAPSQHNSQPWEFIVVKHPDLRRELGEVVERISVHSSGVVVAPALKARKGLDKLVHYDRYGRGLSADQEG